MLLALHYLKQLALLDLRLCTRFLSLNSDLQEMEQVLMRDRHIIIQRKERRSQQPDCPGFTWARVNLIPCFVFRRKRKLITHQCCTCCWAVLHIAKYVAASSMMGLWMYKELWRDRIRAADLNWPKGYSVSYDTTLNNKSGEVGQRSRV